MKLFLNFIETKLAQSPTLPKAGERPQQDGTADFRVRSILILVGIIGNGAEGENDVFFRASIKLSESLK